MRIYLVRHPAPNSIDGLCYGRLDVTVDERVAASAAESIFKEISRETLANASVYSSPSSRCLALAQLLSAPAQPTATDDLMEINFGEWEGTAWDAVPRAQIDAWVNDVWGYRCGGGESAQMVETRWKHWLQHLRLTEQDTVVAVTHAGVIRVALASSGKSTAAAALEAPIAFASVHCLDLA